MDLLYHQTANTWFKAFGYGRKFIKLFLNRDGIVTRGYDKI